AVAATAPDGTFRHFNRDVRYRHHVRRLPAHARCGGPPGPGPPGPRPGPARGPDVGRRRVLQLWGGHRRVRRRGGLGLRDPRPGPGRARHRAPALRLGGLSAPNPYSRLLWLDGARSRIRRCSSSRAGCSTTATTRVAMNRPVRTGWPERVISATSTTPRAVETSTRRPALVAAIS